MLATRASSSARSGEPTLTLTVRQPCSITASRARPAASADATAGMIAFTSISARLASG